MPARLIITAMTYLVAGLIPALTAYYLVRVRLLGGVWATMLVGVVGAFAGGMIDVFFLNSVPDLIPVGGIVDAGPPLIVAVVIVVLFALVSRTNE